MAVNLFVRVGMTTTDLPAPMNPFPGLRPFDFEQHHLFFGREEQVGQLLQVLGEKRFLAVLGPSGSGKSSLIRAGMIPRLYEGRLRGTGAEWQHVIFTPGRRAIDNLGSALREAGVGGADGSAVLHRGAQGLVELVRAGPQASRNLLLVVDQFEELFRLQGEDGVDESALFIEQLLAAVRQRETPIYVVLTLRAEFIGHCTSFQGLAESVNDVDYLVPRMSRDQLRAAIEEPVTVGRAKISPELVDRVLTDIGDNVDQLPVLQHALMRTWDHWVAQHGDGEALGVAHYEAVGTVSDALSQHAEEVYTELPDGEAREIARLLFKTLASGRGAFQDGRRPTSLDEVAAIAGVEPAEVGTVVEHFRLPGRWFLVPPPEVPLRGDTVLDISHESLLRLWRRTRTWMDEETQSAHLYTRLASTAGLYQEGRAGLYQDPDLELALEWRRQNRPTAAWARRHDPSFERAMTFLDHSAEEQDFRRTTEEERRQRNLRRTRRFAVLMGGVSLIFLMGLVVGLNLYFQAEESKRDAIGQQGLAEQERERAEEQRQIAVEHQGAAEGERERAEEQRRIAEEQQGLAEQERERAEEQRQIAVEQQEVAERERERAEEQRHIAEEQQELADQERQIAEQQRQIAVEQQRKAERLRLLSVSRSLAVQAAKIHDRADQGQLATLLALQAYRFHVRYGGSAQDPDIYNALWLALSAFEDESGRILRGHDDAVRAVAFFPGGDQLISGSDDGAVRLWDLHQGGHSTLWRRGPAVRSVAVGPDGHLLAVGSDGGRLQLTRLDDAEAPVLVAAAPVGAEAPVTSIRFSPEGGLLAATWLDGRVGLWSLHGGNATSAAAWRLGSSAHTVAFARDGHVLATGDEDGAVHLWRRDGEPVATAPPPYTAAIRSLSFSADDRWLAAGAANGDLLLWERDDLGAPPRVLIGHLSAIASLGFHPDSRLLASGGLDGTVRIWDVHTPEEEPVLIEQDAWVWSVDFSPDGVRLASGGMDRNVRLWTTHADDLAEDLMTHVERNLTQREWDSFVGEGIPFENTKPDMPDDSAGGQR